MFQPIMIEFTKPNLTITPVRIPKGGVFCVADSGARLNKATTPDYNSRVSQCKQAAKVFPLPKFSLLVLLFNSTIHENLMLLRKAEIFKY